MKLSIAIAALYSCFLGHLIAQDYPNKSLLKLSEIMKGDDFIGHQPDNIRWTMDSKYIVFDWNKYNQPGNSTYAYNVATNVIDSVTADFYLSNPIYSGIENNSVALFTNRGNLYKYDKKTKKSTPIVESSNRISNLQYSIGSDLFYFQLDQSLYSYSPNDGAVKELIIFEKGRESKPSQSTILEQQELELFEYQQIQKEKREWYNAQNDSKSIKKIHYEETSVSNIQISGNGRFITFRLNDYPNTKETHVENHIASDGYTYTSGARAKVGDIDPNHRLGIYDMERDSVYYFNFSSLDGIRNKPVYLSEYRDTTSNQYDKDRNIIMHEIVYSEDGTQNILDIRSYDNKDRWLVHLNLSNGSWKQIDHQHDEAWIGGPGISGWNMVNGNVGFLDNETVYFQSEITGFSALYSYSIKTGKKVRLTGENYEVYDFVQTKDASARYIVANKTHPGNRDVYQLMSDGSLKTIWNNDGYHELFVSPDGKYLAQRYSYKTSPWELYVSTSSKPQNSTKITKSTSPSFEEYQWYNPKVITLQTEENQPVYARIYQPEVNIKNNAAIIFVHGAGYLQNAHNYWSTYHREYMFHNLLRDNGYTVIDIDYRASEGYGRNHRTAIYRHMGGADLKDQLIGRQFLIDSCGIDSTRIGIYGGSYGGFITLMALLTQPGKFKAGAALRSVTDWRHYNHEYTSNILNYPGTDPKAYDKSSPIYFAQNLADRLLMLHGMVDDNVQFQDIVRLSQRFIEMGKTNWELAVFPVEAHGFKISSSWTDEYRRIYNLFYEELIAE